MKITLDLDKKPQFGFEVLPYAGLIAQPPAWLGARAVISVFPTGEDNEHDPVLDLTADDAEALVASLREAAALLDSLVKTHRAEAHDKVKHSVKCSYCGTYSDSRHPAAWGHADGEGRVCLGDGTRLLSPSRVEVRDIEVGWEAVPFTTLDEDQVFRYHDPLQKESPVIYTVVESARSYYDGHRSTCRVRVDHPWVTAAADG